VADQGRPVGIPERLRCWARKIKRDGVTLWYAAQHPETPFIAKLLGAFVVAYALSPIDLIPDFIPVIGYLDDVLLLPGLIWLAIRMLPPHVVRECRGQADGFMASGNGKPVSIIGAALIVAIWVAASWFAWTWWHG